MAEELAHSFLRGLERAESNNSTRDEILTLVMIIVGILVFVWVCWRFWICHAQNRERLAEDIVFNLSEDQRRAALEAIFSETSKVSFIVAS